ncbi:calcium/proton exchanger [Methylomagnum ishizawai]|uniref:calcium/proton exchanger n=1 Tax=Methylomagnum ishizawai TaxID=1760988 RepID=UPI001C323086|nr:calcium/proton exchanger [Methylomagnum ishizawai]BBL74282.1 calcium/proton exchanger [Methylomagnum ishizawai]
MGESKEAIHGGAEPAAKGISLQMWLLLAIPIALVLRWTDASPILVFLVSLVAIYPLAEIMAEATEALAVTLGPTVGGLLNASLNNAPEIIIAMFALKNGLGDVVKASITGSILVELLFGLGLAMMLGGLKHGTQRFDEEAIQINAGLLTLCSFGLVIPAVFHLSSPKAEEELSWEISSILLLIYAVNLGATLLFKKKDEEPAGAVAQTVPEENGEAAPEWSQGKATAILVAATLVLAVMSEVVTDALEPTSKQLGLSDVFSGIILLAGAGGIGEIISATRFARSNKMDLAIEASVGSSIQMILLAVPLLVFAAPLLGTEMNLLFTPFEIVSIVLTTVVIRNIVTDGRSTWMEGLMLLAVYIMLGIGFYYLPADASAGGLG